MKKNYLIFYSSVYILSTVGQVFLNEAGFTWYLDKLLRLVKYMYYYRVIQRNTIAREVKFIIV